MFHAFEYPGFKPLPFTVSLPACGAIAQRRAATKKETPSKVESRQCANAAHENAVKHGTLSNVDTSFQQVDRIQQPSALNAGADAGPAVSTNAQDTKPTIRSQALTNIKAATARRNAVVSKISDRSINAPTADPMDTNESVKGGEISGKKRSLELAQFTDPSTPRKTTFRLEHEGVDWVREEEDWVVVPRAPRKTTKFFDAFA